MTNASNNGGEEACRVPRYGEREGSRGEQRTAHADRCKRRTRHSRV